MYRKTYQLPRNRIITSSGKKLHINNWKKYEFSAYFHQHLCAKSRTNIYSQKDLQFFSFMSHDGFQMEDNEILRAA